MNQSEQLNELAKALAAAQGEIRGAVKDSENPHFRSKYADISSVWDACRAPLSKHGLSVTQTVEGMSLKTTLLHTSGQWMASTIGLILTKSDMQGLGSAITYARRYGLSALVGIAQEDDDGNQVSRSHVGPEQPMEKDGVQDHDTGYRIPFGKYAKRALEEIDTNDLRSYVAYIEKKAEKDGKPITGAVLEFVERASNHIAALELNVETEPGSEG